jgi:uncharacterized membrane protein YgcG
MWLVELLLGRRLRAARWALAVGLLVVYLAIWLFPLLAPPLSGFVHVSQQPGAGIDEQVDRDQVSMVLDADGGLAVTETLTYRFPSGAARHGIFRYIPERVRYDDRYDRRFPISGVTVHAEMVSGTGDPGRAGRFRTYRENQNLVIQIGDADTTVSGVWRYTIGYRVTDTVERIERDPTSSYEELLWNVTGNGWLVPISAVDVRLAAPAVPLSVRCFTGVVGSTASCPSYADGTTVQASGSDLDPGEGVTLAVDLPSEAVADPHVQLVERWTFQRAFEVTPQKALLAALLAAAAVGGLARVLGRHARDRRLAMNAYLPAEAEPDRAGLVGFFERADGPVRFRPPEGATPGLVGVVLDEKADPLDVSATLVDLAVRGYLRIEEVADQRGRVAKDDFRLVRLRDPDDTLLGYERDLLTRLWRRAPDGAVVTLGDLRTTFAGDMSAVRAEMYDEVMARRWFVRRPDHVRAFWYVVGAVAFAAGLALTVLLAAKTHWGLLAIPLLAPGLVLVASAHRMPARTAAGRQVREEAVGYERFLDVADADQLRFQERQLQFVAGLPYAMVFGLTRKWAEVLAVLQERGIDLRPTWYVPYDVGAPFRFYVFGTALSNFSTASSSALSIPPPRSSGGGFGGGGGFSGGGGGGGGGGSW